MKYRVIVLPSAERDIEKLPREIQRCIYKRITLLETNPWPPDYKKLKGSVGYRIRVGDYRVLYEINDDIVTVIITRAGHRKDSYR